VIRLFIHGFKKKWLSFRNLKFELSKFQHQNNTLKNDKSNRYCFSASDSKDTGKGGGALVYHSLQVQMSWIFTWIFLPAYVNFLSTSDGTLKGVQCQGSQPLWHAKDRFPDVRKRVGSLRAIRETQNFKTKALYWTLTAVYGWNIAKTA
jgi:hypothetical protein